MTELATELRERDQAHRRAPADPVVTLVPSAPADVADDLTHDDADYLQPALPEGTSIHDRRSRRLRRRLMIADLSAVIVGFAAAFAIQAIWRQMTVPTLSEHLLLAVGSLPFWFLAFGVHKLYAARAVERPIEEMRRLASSSLAAMASIVGAAFVLQYETLSRGWVFTATVVVFLVLVVERRVARQIFLRLRQSGSLQRRVAVIGGDAEAVALMRRLGAPSLGYEVVGYFAEAEIETCDSVWLGRPVDAVDDLRIHHCVGAVISLGSVEPDVVNHLTRRLSDHGYHVTLSSALCDIDVTRLRPQLIDGQALMYVEPRVRDGWRASAKRCFDVSMALFGLAISAPIIAVAALAIKLNSPGPVFFRQERVGLDGERFGMIKLRSMYVDAEDRLAELMADNEADGPLFKLRSDPRITAVGRIIRKLSIDELPQFWNVVRGDMSVVGPRPALPQEVHGWTPDLHERLAVLPGITGMWQVSGRSESSFEEYKRLDLYYVHNWSLFHDLRIVVKTLVTIVTQRGAF